MWRAPLRYVGPFAEYVGPFLELIRICRALFRSDRYQLFGTSFTNVIDPLPNLLVRERKKTQPREHKGTRGRWGEDEGGGKRSRRRGGAK